MLNKLNLIQLNKAGTELPALILLHGFTGRATDWLESAEYLKDICRPVLIDLPGCGESPFPGNEAVFKPEGISRVISEALKDIPGKKIIGGYSMGARAALLTFIKHPEDFAGIVLISGTAGISDPAGRKSRSVSDELLAKKVSELGVEKFIAGWMDNPLFRGLKNLPTEKYEKIVRGKKANSPHALACWLKHFSPGLMPDMWPHLKNIQVPVLLAYGSDDSKYADLSKRMAGEIKNAELIEIAGSGHNVHQEKPVELATGIKAFIKKNIN